MSIIQCPVCGAAWNATQIPVCPQCQTNHWEQCPNLITPKHDPGALPSASTSYRSTVTEEFILQKHAFLEFAAFSGNWYFSQPYGKYCHFTPRPLGEFPGSGIPSGSPMPEHALDCLLIADASHPQSAHAYAVDRTRFEDEIRQGRHTPLPGCCIAGCDNIAVPGDSKCVQHQGAY